MKPTYSGFEAKKQSNFAQLPPPGAYIAEIQGVKTEESYDKSRDVIVLMIEITEGEYAGQYHKVFENQKNGFGDSVKYKGTFRLIPFMEGDEPWVKSKFEGNLWAVEDSNPDYTWDWDEKKLKGKKVGISVRKSVYKGRDGSEKETTEIGQLESINDVKNGKCKLLKERRQKNLDSDSSGSGEATDVTGQVEVPF